MAFTKKGARFGSWSILLVIFSLILTQPALGQRGSREKVKTASGNKLKGDLFTTNTFNFSNSCYSLDGQVELPVYGRAKVGENNSALPEDRYYLVYQNFQNSLNSSIADGVGTVDNGLTFDRFTLGVEKTFAEGDWSLEMRMPLYGDVDYFQSGVSQQVGGVGNLSLIGKKLIHSSENSAWAAGLGLSLPTGAESRIQVANEQFTVGNDAVHLFPFVGFLSAPREKLFFQGFMQLDIPVNGNSLSGREIVSGSPEVEYGRVKDQLLFYLDLSAGYWLYQNPESRAITSCAATVELNYSTTLEDSGAVTGTTYHCVGGTGFAYGNAANQFDVVNFNTGFHLNWFNKLNTFLGVVAPASSGTNRFFDLEPQMTFNFNY